MSTPLQKKPNRGNSKSDPALDKVLLKHLASENRHRGVAYLDWETEEEREKAKNQLRYLKSIKKRNFEDFVDICLAHKVEYPFQIQEGIVIPLVGFDGEFPIWYFLH